MPDNLAASLADPPGTAPIRNDGGKTAGVLVVRRLRIDRMPGFPVSGFTLNGLSPGINILHGPNGAGKTTAGRAIQGLFWPDANLKHARVTGDVLIQGQLHTLVLEDGYSRDTAEGRTPGELGAPPADTRDRYRLAFHDLIAGDNADFAEYILRESVGGYDIAAAGRALGFRPEVQRPDKKRNAVKAAQEVYRAALGQQQTLDLRASELRRMEDDLQSLQQTLRQRRRDAERQQRIREYQTLRRDEREAALTLRRFPVSLRRFTGAEREAMDLLDRRENEHRHSLRRWLADRRAARTDRRALGLPPSEDLTRMLTTLRIRAESLGEAAEMQEELDRRLIQAEAREREARRRRDPDLEFSRLDAIDGSAISEMAHYLRRLSAHTGRQSARTAIESWVGTSSVPHTDPDTLRAAEECLAGWLAAPRSAAPAPLLKAACAILGVSALLACGALILAGQQIAWAGVAAAAIAAVLAMRPPGNSEQARSFQERFARLAAKPPGQWTPDLATARLREIRGELAETERGRWMAEQRAVFARQMEAVTAEGDALARDRARLGERFGLILDPEGHGDGALLHAIETLQHWHAVAEDLSEARAAATAQELVCATRLRAVNDSLREAWMEPVETFDEARAACRLLESRVQRRMAADGAARNAGANGWSG